MPSYDKVDDAQYELVSKRILQRAASVLTTSFGKISSTPLLHHFTQITHIPTPDLLLATLILLIGLITLHPLGPLILFRGIEGALCLRTTWRAVYAGVGMGYWDATARALEEGGVVAGDHFEAEGRSRRWGVKRAVEGGMMACGWQVVQSSLMWLNGVETKTKAAPGQLEWWILVFKVWTAVYFSTRKQPATILTPHKPEEEQAFIEEPVVTPASMRIPHGITVMTTPPTPIAGLDLDEIKTLLHDPSGDDSADEEEDTQERHSRHAGQDSVSSIASSLLPETPPASVPGEVDLVDTSIQAEADLEQETTVSVKRSLPHDLADSIRAVSRFRKLLSEENDRLEAAVVLGDASAQEKTAPAAVEPQSGKSDADPRPRGKASAPPIPPRRRASASDVLPSDKIATETPSDDETIDAIDRLLQQEAEYTL